jgi:hypothetical protein
MRNEYIVTIDRSVLYLFTEVVVMILAGIHRFVGPRLQSDPRCMIWSRVLAIGFQFLVLSILISSVISFFCLGYYIGHKIEVPWRAVVNIYPYSLGP